MSAQTEGGLLSARLFDALSKRDKGKVAVLGYLTPRESRQAQWILAGAGREEEAFFFGGYDGAERVCLFLLPDYVLALLPEPPRDCPCEAVLELLEDAAKDAITPILISGSGFRTLTHRDYLGSILALGVERDSFGDIALQNDHEAVVFCSRSMATFFLETLERVGSDSVKCKLYEVDDRFTDGRRYEAIRDTVASPRLDCVVAALTNTSREEAKRLIETGFVEVEFEPTDKCDLLLTPPLALSVRGYGRYRLLSFDGKTKKDRLRLCADRLI